MSVFGTNVPVTSLHNLAVLGRWEGPAPDQGSAEPDLSPKLLYKICLGLTVFWHHAAPGS